MITLGEIRVKAGQLEENFKAIEFVVNTSNHKTVLLPHLSLTGYHLGDLYKSSAFLDDVWSYHDKIAQLSQGNTIIMGSLLQEEGKLYQAILVFEDGMLLDNPVIKNDLNSYDVDYFHTKESEQTITILNKVWKVSFDREIADADTIVFGLDAYDKNHLEFYNAGIYINPMGLSNLKDNVYVYVGGSYQLNDILQSFDSVSDAMVTDIEEREEKILEAVKLGITWFDEEVLPFKPKWIVGVSGGLDSSLTVALLATTLGSNRIIGVNMPSEYTRDITKSNAKHLSDALGYESYIIPIKDMTQGTKDAFAYAGFDNLEGLTYENVQARLRGHTLMTLSSLTNGVISNNGNKIETALGYATLYGDAIGVLALLGDLNKLEVGALAERLNKNQGKVIVPSNLIPKINDDQIEWDFAPSAELAQDQFDPMKWGYHDYLIEYLQGHDVESIMEAYLDGSILNLPMGPYLKAYGLDIGQAFMDDLEWVINTRNRAIYKRIQSPPILTLSKLGFPNESQRPVIKTSHYKTLKEEIIKRGRS